MEARRSFPKLGEADLASPKLGPDYTLTMSHKRRVQINRLQNQSLKQPGATFIRAPVATRAGNQPQSMWIWPGLQLIGAGGKCLKGLFYTVEGVEEDSVVLNTGRLSHQECVRSLRLP